MARGSLGALWRGGGGPPRWRRNSYCSRLRTRCWVGQARAKLATDNAMRAKAPSTQMLGVWRGVTPWGTAADATGTACTGAADGTTGSEGGGKGWLTMGPDCIDATWKHRMTSCIDTTVA